MTIKNIDAGRTGNERTRSSSRETLGWYDDEAVYIPTQRMREAAGSHLKQQQVAKTLNARGLLAKRGSATRLAIKYMPGVGYVQSYALRRSKFGKVDAVDLPCDVDADDE